MSPRCHSAAGFPTPKGSRHFAGKTPITAGIGHFDADRAGLLRRSEVQAQKQLDDVRTLRAIAPDLREGLKPHESPASCLITFQRFGLPQMGHDMLHDAAAFLPEAAFHAKWLQSALRIGEYPFRDAPMD